MQALPPPLSDLIEALGNLPGVGPRTAERYAYFIVQNDPHLEKEITRALSGIHNKLAYCPKTFALIDSSQKVSPLYSDPHRNKKIVAVVSSPFDIVALERTSQYHGTYHVLGGLISPIDGIGPEQLHIKELIKRIDGDNVEEIILATNASVEGESTALYIRQQLGDRKVKITRLARGIPIGVDLEYTDQITLGRALEGRTAL